MDQIQIKDLECYCHHGVLKRRKCAGTEVFSVCDDVL